MRKCDDVRGGDITVSLQKSREIKAVAAMILCFIALGGPVMLVAPESPPLAGSPGSNGATTPVQTNETLVWENSTGHGGINGVVDANGSVVDANDNVVNSNGSVVDANNQFAFDLYSSIRNEASGNIFFSPYSIFVACAMAYEGARGQTAAEMQSVFHFPDDNATLRSSIAAIDNELNENDANSILRVANALWVQKDYPLLDEYLAVIENYYAGNATNVDFRGANEQTRQTINAWVENKTENMINDLIPQGELDPSTVLLLTNAIYFNGTWVQPFNADETRNETFTVSENQTVEVPMMSSSDGSAFNYAEEPNLQILEMPYQGGNLSMLVLLPKDGNLASLEDSLTLEKLDQWRRELGPRPVDVYFPRFNLTAASDLSENLKAMGMPSAFFPGTANFSGMDGTRNLYIGSVIHKAYINVNEKGTEAAAATAVCVLCCCVTQTPVFLADHPFMFMILDRTTGTILFMGSVVNPTQ
jgi:serpin B